MNNPDQPVLSEKDIKKLSKMSINELLEKIDSLQKENNTPELQTYLREYQNRYFDIHFLQTNIELMNAKKNSK